MKGARTVPPNPSGPIGKTLYRRDQVVGGTGLAVIGREGSEAEAWREFGLE